MTTISNKLHTPVRHIPKHNVLIIRGNRNAHKSNGIINTSCLLISPIGYGHYHAEFSIDDRLLCLNPTYQRRDGKPLIYTNQNKL